MWVWSLIRYTNIYANKQQIERIFGSREINYQQVVTQCYNKIRIKKSIFVILSAHDNDECYAMLC